MFSHLDIMFEDVGRTRSRHYAVHDEFAVRSEEVPPFVKLLNFRMFILFI